MLNQEESYPVGTACELLELPHSTYYYQPVPTDESELGAAIDEIAGQYPTYGTRRVTHQLRRAPYQMRVNRKRVRRIMAQKGLLRLLKRRKKRTKVSKISSSWGVKCRSEYKPKYNAPIGCPDTSSG